MTDTECRRTSRRANSGTDARSFIFTFIFARHDICERQSASAPA
jgi:hypothetical protein